MDETDSASTLFYATVELTASVCSPPPGFKGHTCDNCQRIKAIYRSHMEHMADPRGLASLFHLS